MATPKRCRATSQPAARPAAEQHHSGASARTTAPGVAMSGRPRRRRHRERTTQALGRVSSPRSSGAEIIPAARRRDLLGDPGVEAVVAAQTRGGSRPPRATRGPTRTRASAPAPTDSSTATWNAPLRSVPRTHRLGAVVRVDLDPQRARHGARGSSAGATRTAGAPWAPRAPPPGGILAVGVGAAAAPHAGAGAGRRRGGRGRRLDVARWAIGRACAASPPRLRRRRRRARERAPAFSTATAGAAAAPRREA
jgi:hypothetical protein